MSQLLFKFQKTSEMSNFTDFRNRDNTKYEISQTTWDAVVWRAYWNTEGYLPGMWY